MKRQVALIVETSSGYGRELMTGIVRYMRMHDEWSVFLEQRDLWKKPPAWLEDWRLAAAEDAGARAQPPLALQFREPGGADAAGYDVTLQLTPAGPIVLQGTDGLSFKESYARLYL